MSEAFQPGFGARLKAGREAKKLAVADVAAKLKLTSRQVEALESEDLSHLPSEVFVRGFVRNYGRLVDVDTDSLIAPVDVQAAVAETITAPSAGVTFANSGIRRWVVLPLIALAVFLILVAALYHWLRQGEDSLVVAEPATPAQPQLQPAVPAPPVNPAPVESQTLQLTPDAVVVPDGTPAGMPPASPVPQTAHNSAASVPPGIVAQKPAVPVAPALPPQPVPAKPAITPLPAKPAAAPLPAPAVVLPPPTLEKPAPGKPAGAHSLRFEPAQDAWIQVVDGKGNRFSKLVRAGSAESFSGEPPFRLVVGEAARVRMSYDGHVIDLTPFIGQKVARLTLE